MEFYESTYFIILIPSVVITIIFLFFWLFMKETSYDEVLAKQKKDHKLPPVKVDKKKMEKKKNKKKEAQNGHLHESDSETANREFDLMDAQSSEEEHVVPAPVIEAEPVVNVRERKKKDKKPPKPVTEEPAGKEINGTKPPGKKAEPVPVTKQPTPPADASGSKKKGAKKLKNGTDESPVSQEIKNEQVVPSTKKQEPPSSPADVKPQESGSGKRRSAVKKQKIDTLSALVDEPVIQAAVSVPSMDNTAEQVVEKKVEKEAAVRAEPAEGPPRGGSKKAKMVTDKENAEVKFKDLVSAMRSLTLSEEEAMAVMEMLKEKSRAVQEIVRKANKGDAAALQQVQEKERLLVAAWEEAAGVKEQYKHLSQELLGEKQKTSLMEAKARERIAAMEKEHSVFQSKMHCSYQDAQQMQLKFQQVREQLETQLSHLKQENSILRDAVSAATNQMENKQSSELNKLRQDCTRLMNELTEKNNKMVQEEMQKKSSEQVASQLKAQIQEAERRVEEAETYLRSRLAEYDVIQQEMQGKLHAKESEIQTLHSKLTDTMVSNQQLEQRILQLMEASQSEGLQMHIQDLLKQNEALNLQIQKYHSQIQAQSSASVLVEELQKTIIEKDKEMKLLENTLTIEHKNFINSGEEFKVIQRENVSLKSELLKLQVAVSEQAVAVQALDQMQKSVHERDQKIRALEEQLQREVAKVSSNLEDYTANREVLGKMEMSIQEKDDKIKTVEELLEAGLIEMANKEEELRVLRSENASLRMGVENLRTQQANQVSLDSVVEDLKQVILEKEGKMKSVEDLFQAEHKRADKHEKTAQTLREEVESLKEALKISQQEKAEQVSSQTQIQELQKRLKQKEEALQLLEVRWSEREGKVTIKEKQLEDLERECDAMKVHIEEVEKKLQQQDSAPAQVQSLQKTVIEQEEKVKALAASLEERETHLVDTCQKLQVLGAEYEALKARSCEHQQQTQQVQSAAPSQELLRALSDKDAQIEALRGEAESLKSALEQQRKKNNDLREKNWKAMEALASTEKMLQDKVNKTAKVRGAEAEARHILHRLFPDVAVPVSLSDGEWVQEFGKMVKGLNESDAGREKVLEQKLKEGEEIHSLLQLECEKYKSVLAETEGILQRLQRSVEEEEGRWKVKVEESQKELKEVLCTVGSLEEEVERLKHQDKQSQNLQKEREHLETELEKAEHERGSYVSEVRELKDLLTELRQKLDGSYSEASRQNEELALLKTQLRETLQKLEGEQSERQKVAKDVHEAQKSLDLIELEILKAAGDSTVTDPTSDAEAQEPREKSLPSLSQSVTRLQQCLQALNQQLTKGREHYQVIG